MDPEDSNWVSATVNTLDGRILPYIQKICKRDPLSGKVVTGGIVTVKDSSWLLSWTINRQPQYRNQPKGQVLVWLYGMFSDRPGDYVKKPCASAPAWRSVRNGSIIWAFRGPD
jgi:oleate hydratase